MSDKPCLIGVCQQCGVQRMAQVAHGREPERIRKFKIDVAAAGLTLKQVTVAKSLDLPWWKCAGSGGPHCAETITRTGRLPPADQGDLLMTGNKR